MALRHAVALLAIAACAHEKPFSPDDFSSDSTLTRGSARQLTYNLGTDLTPAWLPDGNSLLFTFEDLSRADLDRCLGELPATGGTIRNTLCATTDASLDSLDAFYESAAGPDGRILLVHEASPPQSATPAAAALILVPGDDRSSVTIVRPYPYTATSGIIHGGISNVRWLSADRAIYLAQRVLYAAPCSSCELDTLKTGIELVEVDLSGPTPVTRIIPNTADASSVAAGENTDLIYFTRNGDSRVYHMRLSTGATEIVHDFGSGIIARDAYVVGNTLYVVIGGKVSYVNDVVLGFVQRDQGGMLVRVDLTTGVETIMFVDERYFRRPAASPTGDRVVAEGFFATETAFDTTISRSSDLWLFEIP